MTRLPNTAMPSAPPSSRVVSLTAEPTPALARGTALMMPPVAGAAVTAMPAASSTIATTSTAYEVETPTRVRTAIPRATSAKP